MKYSLIIATYNRLPEIRELLDSLDSLDYPKADFEVIISDDGSKDGTKDYVKSLDSDLQIVYLFQQNKGPGEARNHGMIKARGSYFIYLDSDCMVPVHWLSAIDEAVEKDRLDAFGGPDTYHPSFSPLLKAINYAMTSFIGTGGTRGNKKSVGKFYPRSFNMGISREVFEKVGGMNKLRHGQDMDLSARIYAAGFKVGLIPDAYVYHKRRTSIRKFFRQIFNWGVARVNLGKAHPQLLKPVHFLPSMVVLGTLLSVGISLILGWSWIWKLVLAGFVTICIWAFIESFMMYKNLKTSLLSIITLVIQVFAYGLGMLWAWPQALAGKEAHGFVKGYYGKKTTESR